MMIDLVTIVSDVSLSTMDSDSHGVLVVESLHLNDNPSGLAPRMKQSRNRVSKKRCSDVISS
jgi:hypothetical protein